MKTIKIEMFNFHLLQHNKKGGTNLKMSGRKKITLFFSFFSLLSSTQLLEVCVWMIVLYFIVSPLLFYFFERPS
jgi:hypothetical protein